MLYFVPRSSVLALLALALAGANGAVAQSPADDRQTGAPTAHTAAVTPEPSSKSHEDDDVRHDTPPQDSEKTAIRSNGAAGNTTQDSQPGAAETEATPAHPVIIALIKNLTQTTDLHKQENKDDIAAIGSFYTDQPDKPVWTGNDGLTRIAQDALAEIRKADEWGLKAADFDLPSRDASSWTTDAQADAELKIAIAVLKYARFARGGRIEPASVSRLFDQTPEIAEPAVVLRDLTASTDIAAALRDFHPKHPQFERLRQALLKLRRDEKNAAVDTEDNKSVTAENQAKSNTSKTGKQKTKSEPAASALKLIVNMERWRWLPRDLGDFYVWDDVPAQMASVFDHGKVVFKEKMVVGKSSTPTPMFSAPMQYIIFHPSWGVPPGMKKNELGPQLRNTGGGWFSSKPLASSVLRSHGLRVTRDGRPVDPDSVDWSSANISSYHFTQPPGPTNVLGIVKFRFPNKHNVYMHDTPERHLFEGRARTFSHGCMRVQNPIRLAEVLLKFDKGWDADRVKSAKNRGENITLSNPIPVHVAYFTAEVDDDGKLDLRGDIYGLDNRTASKLEGRRVRVGGPAVARKKSTKRKRRYVRKKKPEPKKKPFNPFASLSD